MYAGKGFQDVHMATLGLDFISQDVKPKSAPNSGYNLKIWDTAGQERFKSLTMTFYKQSQGMMICFDLTKPKTFESVRRWIVAVKSNCEANVATLLIGNKCDLVEERAVTREEAEQLAADNNMQYFETSARGSINVSEAFVQMIDQVYVNKFASAADNPPPARDTIKLGRGSEKQAKARQEEQKKKKGCC